MTTNIKEIIAEMRHDVEVALEVYGDNWASVTHQKISLRSLAAILDYIESLESAVEILQKRLDEVEGLKL